LTIQTAAPISLGAEKLAGFASGSGSAPRPLGHRVRRIETKWQPADQLLNFQADFALKLGAGFADPDHAAALADRRKLIEDKLDHLAALKVEASTHPETSL
jgi:hypothetical protein